MYDNTNRPKRESPIVTETVSDKVYRHLKDAIIRGDLRRGQRIVQEQLTEELQVSRTPIRDALQRLSAEGLVVSKPFHGAVVFELSERELHELYDIRILMENYACEHSLDTMSKDQLHEMEVLNDRILSNRNDVHECMACDSEFHMIACCSNNLHYIKPFLDSVWDKSNPYKALYYTVPRYVEETYKQHKQIIDCFARKDRVLLSQSIESHLRDVVHVVSMNPLFHDA